MTFNSTLICQTTATMLLDCHDCVATL